LQRWRGAREKRKTELVAVEGNSNFEGVHRCLSYVLNLSSEKRLLCHLYFAIAP
jgi:hypothetical protein